MKATTIITAKIRPDIYQLIKQGNKQYEVRDESFQGAETIRYIRADDSKLLGIYRLGPEDALDRTHDNLLQALAGVSLEMFDGLFPRTETKFCITCNGVKTLYVAHIGKHLESVEDLFREES